MKLYANGGVEHVMIEPISRYTRARAQCQLISEMRICYKWHKLFLVPSAEEEFGFLTAVPLH